MTIHVGSKNQVTLPKEVVRKAKLGPGDPLEVLYQDDVIILRPQVQVPREQAYFWTKQWQVREREAEKDIGAGRLLGPFAGAKEMRRHFNKRAR